MNSIDEILDQINVRLEGIEQSQKFANIPQANSIIENALTVDGMLKSFRPVFITDFDPAKADEKVQDITIECVILNEGPLRFDCPKLEVYRDTSVLDSNYLFLAIMVAGYILTHEPQSRRAYFRLEKIEQLSEANEEEEPAVDDYAGDTSTPRYLTRPAPELVPGKVGHTVEEPSTDPQGDDGTGE